MNPQPYEAPDTAPLLPLCTGLPERAAAQSNRHVSEQGNSQEAHFWKRVGEWVSSGLGQKQGAGPRGEALIPGEGRPDILRERGERHLGASAGHRQARPPWGVGQVRRKETRKEARWRDDGRLLSMHPASPGATSLPFVGKRIGKMNTRRRERPGTRV